MRRRTPPPKLVQFETRDLPSFYGNTLFPGDNPWNQRVDAAPVAANSAAIIAHIVNRAGTGANPRLHPDFGNPVTNNALYGIPVTVVDGSQAKVPVLIGANGYAGESDIVNFPIPSNAVIEGDGPFGPAAPSNRGDSHVVVYDKTNNVVYESYLTARPTETVYPGGDPHSTGQWGAYQTSVWDLNTNAWRTPAWTSADAAGLPILPGLVRPDEALPASAGGQGVISHAIRVTVHDTLNKYVYPASHQASSRTGSDLPRMGERFRLSAGFVIPSSWSPEAKAIAQAMKDYGLIVADNGSDFFFQGTPSTDWNDDNLSVLKTIRAANFEIVDLTPVVTGLSVSLGSPTGDTAVTVFGQNFGGAAGNLSVLFGAVPGTAVTVLSDTAVSVLAPAGAVGTVAVTVRSGKTKPNGDGNPVFFGYGTSPATAAAQFTYATGVPPTVPPTTPPTVPPTTPPTVPPTTPPTVPPTTPPTVPPMTPPTVPPTTPPTVPPTTPPTVPPTTPPTVPPTTPPAVPPLTPPTVPPTVASQFAVGTPTGVLFYNADGSLRFAAEPFARYSGGVRVASSDFNGDGQIDVVAATGPGRSTRVVILDGATKNELFAVEPFEASFTGGVYVAVGDLDGDGSADLIVTPDEGGGPRVDVYSGANFGKLASFFGIDDTNFRGGARASAGDLNGDHRTDLIVVAGFGGGPRVAAFDGKSVGGTPTRLFGDFFAFEQTLRNGVFVAAGDVNGDGTGDLIVGGGPGGGPRVIVFDGEALLANTYAPLANFFGGDTAGRGGIRVAAKDLDADGRADVLVGAGAGSGGRVTGYRVRTLGDAATPSLLDFDALAGGTGGVFVG